MCLLHTLLRKLQSFCVAWNNPNPIHKLKSIWHSVLAPHAPCALTENEILPFLWECAYDSDSDCDRTEHIKRMASIHFSFSQHLAFKRTLVLLFIEVSYHRADRSLLKPAAKCKMFLWIWLNYWNVLSTVGIIRVTGVDLPCERYWREFWCMVQSVKRWSSCHLSIHRPFCVGIKVRHSNSVKIQFEYRNVDVHSIPKLVWIPSKGWPRTRKNSMHSNRNG